MMYLMIAGVCGIAIWFAFRMAEQKGREKERLATLQNEAEKLKEYRSEAKKMEIGLSLLTATRWALLHLV